MKKKYFIRVCLLHETEGYCEDLLDTARFTTQEEAITNWEGGWVNWQLLEEKLEDEEFLEINLMEAFSNDGLQAVSLGIL